MNKIIAVVALAIAVGLYALGHYVDYPEPYLFPRLISIGMGLFAVAMLMESFSGTAGEERGSSIPWLTILPALVVFLACVNLAEDVGFYVTAFCTFFVLVTIYAPDWRSPRGWLNRTAVSLLFMGAMYAVFALLLKVQTPTGLFI